MTLTMFAAELGITPQYLYAIETGLSKMSPRVIDAFDKRFGQMKGGSA